MHNRNVLVFPGGTEVGLEVRNSLAYRKEVTLFSASAPGSNHAPFVYLTHDEVPTIEDPRWFSVLCDIAEARSIDYVFATHEDVLLELGRRRVDLPCDLITHPQETLELVRSKRSTYSALREIVRTPQVYSTTDVALPFPVFVKPDRGAGSRASLPVHSSLELESALRMDDDMLVLEYARGAELTVDCLSDRERGLLYCGPRVRTRMRSGISMDSSFVNAPEIRDIAERICSVITLHGAWFFQVRKTHDDEWCLLEVGARIGGTMALSRVRGVNLPWLSILEAERAPFEVLLGAYEARIDRALVNRWLLDVSYSTVYVDLDDTLLLHDKVNLPVVQFLFQALNQGKRIVVITRHEGDPASTLTRHRLGSIADEIVHVDRGASKVDAISDRDAIFVDDSFGERLEVSRRTGIPTFDVNMLEGLLDERV